MKWSTTTFWEKRAKEKRSFQEQISAELKTGSKDLLLADRQVQLGDLKESNRDQHAYCLLAMETARIVGRMSTVPPIGIG